MRAEIISVGTELLLGHTINTDAAHVARELSALGVDLLQVQTLGDNAPRLEAALREALARAEIVITTGGLGPTDDDLTKETVARVAGVPLEEDADSLARLLEYFGSRPMSANQRKQALLPRGATAFPNAVGTAPGCAVPVGEGRWALMLPGPPSELLPMLQESVVPFLAGRGGAVIASFMVRTFGMGEGAAALRIAGLTDGANPTAATYAGDCEMFVRITAKAPDAAAARALALPAVDEVRRRLGPVVYGVNVESLEAVVVAELARQGKTVATAESCTGGLLAKRITDRPGSSQVFGYGLVTYANEAKMRLLDVPEAMLRAHGAVSPEVARTMAEHARRNYGTDFGLGITGVAGPDGGTPAKPVGLVYVALSDGQNVWLRIMRAQGRYLGRERTRRLASSHALDMLRRRLTGLPVEGDWALEEGGTAVG
ncbi:competence/damage-inducible protein A [Desulfovibrio legallii]|uniref:CinA-like protein n=1 Tax=Desulfovibrio legallii TaxID=571438 RepID=A0A1G7QEZ7_9BACT|nr:competence/damage-inducible protein A [Desulfovibrio legallii]SDF97074.1 nicotinamide-nucleotide amidase [Desulfovibrio legallii]